MNTLSGLPELPLIHILNKLNRDDLLQARLVCKRWRQLINSPRFMKKLTVYVHGQKFYPPSISSCTSLMTMIEATQRICMTGGSSKFVKSFFTTFGAQIKGLEVQCPVNSLSLLPNLKELRLRRLSFVYERIPESVEVVFVYEASRFVSPHQYHMIQLLKQQKQKLIIQKFTSKAEDSEMLMPFFDIDENVASLIQHHGPTQSLCIGLGDINVLERPVLLTDITALEGYQFTGSEEQMQLLQQCTNLIELVDIQGALNSPCFYMHNELNLMNLKKLRIDEGDNITKTQSAQQGTFFFKKPRNPNGGMCEQCWTTFMRNCPNIEELEISCKSTQIFFDNLPKQLRSLTINYDGPTGELIKLNLKSVSNTLKELYIMNMKQQKPYDIKMWGELRNLKKIRLRKVWLSKKDVNTLVKICPNIDYGYFEECTKTSELLVTLRKVWEHNANVTVPF